MKIAQCAVLLFAISVVRPHFDPPSAQSTVARKSRWEPVLAPERRPSVKFLIEPRYSSISNSTDGIIMIQQGTDKSARYGFMKDTGYLIADTIYEDTLFLDHRATHTGSDGSSGYAEGLAPVKKNGRWGYIDMDGKVAIDFQYDSAGLFEEGLAVVDIGGKDRYIDRTGKTVLRPICERACSFHRGVAIVQRDGKYGFMARDGRWLIEPKYDNVDFGPHHSDAYEKNGFVWIIKGDLQGLVKLTGNGRVQVLAEPRYSRIRPYENNKASFTLLHKDEDGCYGLRMTEGYLDETGKEIARWVAVDDKGVPQKDKDPFRKSGAAVQDKNHKWGYVDDNLNSVIACQYDEEFSFNDRGWAIVRAAGRYGVIDRKGKLLLDPVYQTLEAWVEDYIIAQRQGRQFLVSSRDFRKIGDEYDWIEPGTEVHKVRRNGRYGGIDSRGKELVSPLYDDCRIETGYAWVKQNNEWIYLDVPGGQRKFGIVCDDVHWFVDGFAEAKRGDHWGVIDTQGRVVVPFSFDSTCVLGKGLVSVEERERYGIVKIERGRHDSMQLQVWIAPTHNPEYSSDEVTPGN